MAIGSAVSEKRTVERERAARQAMRARSSEAAWHINVAVVDDDAGDMCLIKEALQKNAHVGDVAAFSSPEEALFAMAEGRVRPGLIFLDLCMPKVSGFTFMNALREIPTMAFTPVALLTTSRSVRDVERSRVHDINSYVVKPDSFSELEERLGAVIKSVAAGRWR